MLLSYLQRHRARLTLSRWQFELCLISAATAGVVVGSYLSYVQLFIPSAYAAISPWSQTDWSGGQSVDVATDTTTQFTSSENIDTSVAGQLSLDISAKTALLQGNQLSTGSTNLNVSAKTPLSFNLTQDLFADTYSYSGDNPSRIYVDEAGDYLLALTMPFTSDGQDTSNDGRNAIEAEVRINGVRQDVGYARSSFLRNDSSHTRSSNHLNVLLENLDANDYIEVYISKYTEDLDNTLTGTFTAYLEQVADSQTVFAGTATQTTNSTNLNQSTAYPFQWTSSRKDTGYTHDNQTNSHQIELNEIGHYLVLVNVPMYSTEERPNLKGRILLDDSPVVGGIFQQGYIRNINNHSTSSIHYSGVIETSSLDQLLTVTVEQEAKSGTVTTGGEKATIFVQRLPTNGIYYGQATQVGGADDWSPDYKSTINWATDELIDTDIYTHDTGSDNHEITIDQAGDYLLVYNSAVTGGGGRSNPIVSVQVDGSDVSGAEANTGYVRKEDDHDSSSHALVFPLYGLTAGQKITVSLEQGSSKGDSMDDDAPALVMLWKKGYATTGTLTSQVFDPEYPINFGNLSYSTSGSGTVEVKVRSSASSDMSGATDFDSCTAIADDADMSDNACVTDGHQYFQYQVVLNSGSGSTPIFEDISLAFVAQDQTAPVTNASGIAMSTASSGGIAVEEGEWNNVAAPYFSWTAGADNEGGVGLKGYCLYMGTDNAGDPASTAGLLTNSPVSTVGTTCGFITASTSLDLSSGSYLSVALSSGSTYYLNIKAIDIAYNVFSGSAQSFYFDQDNTAPTNLAYISTPSTVFANVNDMSFSWPSTGVSSASDNHSGLLGLQYQINDTSGVWKGTETDSTCGVDYVPLSDGSYTLTEAQDAASIALGNNIVYVRAIDTACNSSTIASYRTGNISYGGAAPTFATSCQLTNGVTVTPTTSDENNFALSWETATPAEGQSITNYYYMINTSPPALLSTINSNTATYIDNGTGTSVTADALGGAVKGSNTVYVVVVDDADNYSASNCLQGQFTLDSELPDPPLNLAASDSSIKNSSLWRASLGWDEPAYTGTGELTYQVERSSDGETWTVVTTTSGTSFIDTVPESQLYYWRVATYDSSSESQASPSYANAVSLIPKGTFDTPPELTSGPTVTNITTKRATISWGTNRKSDSRIQFGTESGTYFDEEPSNSDQVTSHEIKLNNLAPGTTYYYKAKWTDEDGNVGTSVEKTFTTAAAPKVKEARATSISISSAVIEFTVANASQVKILYGPTNSYGSVKTVSTGTAESTYTVQLTDLTDETKYFFQIDTLDSEGDEYTGDVNSFTTLPRPRLSQVRIQQVKGAAQPTVLVTWLSNTPISSIVSYYPSDDPSLSRDEVDVKLTSGQHRMVIRGLLPQRGYQLQVRGRDRLGNEAVSDVINFTTASDTRPPLISDLRVEGSILKNGADGSLAQLTVSWTTDEAAMSQVEFGEGTGSVYSQRTQQDANLKYNHLVVISGLTPSKVYHFRALAEDDAGNLAESIDTVTITPKATDNALDLVIGNLSEAFGFLKSL